MPATTSREQWVEIFRTLAAILVVGSHLPVGLDGRNYIYPVFLAAHVPLFYIFSGYFIKGTDWTSAFRHALLILIPYVVWSMMSAWVADAPFSQFIHRLLNGPYTHNGSLWFLRDLIVLLLLVPVVKTRKAAMITAAASYIIFQLSPEHLCIRINEMYLTVRFPESMAWFFMGFALQKFSLQELRSFILKYWVPALTLAILVTALNLYDHAGNGWLKYVKIIGCMGYLAVSVAIDQYLPRVGKIVASFGQATFLCYVAHRPFFALFELYNGMKLEWWTPAHTIIASIAFAILCLPINILIVRFLPWAMPLLLGRIPKRRKSVVHSCTTDT